MSSTLEGIHSRITEAEERINEVEVRMVEINEAEKEKRIKRNDNSVRSGTKLNAPIFES